MHNRIPQITARAGIGRLCLLVTVATLLMTSSSTAQVDRTKQPAPDPAPAVAFPPYETFTLKNGLRVFMVRDPRPLVTYRLLVRSGNAADGDITGLADAVADQLAKGTRTRTALQFAQEIDFIGGNVGASATPDAISVTAGGLRKHMAKIVELFADAVKSPTFPAEELEKYQQEAITNLKSQKARAEFLADGAVNKVLYGETPYGRMQSEDAYKKLSSEKLKAYHSTYFVPGNATLAFIGNLSKEELQAQLEAAFGDWNAGTVPALVTPQFPELKGRRIILVDRPTAVQSAIRVLGNGPLLRDPERPRTFILNSVLGGGTGLGNRLAMNLRETHAYTYTPYSTFDANYFKGHFVAAADVRNAVTDSALKEFYYEINRIQTERVPDDELRRNVQSAVGGFLMSIADPTTTAVRVQSIDFYGLPKDYYEKLASVYSSVTPDQIMSLAKRFLNSDNLTVVVVGKASEVKSKLEQFGTVELWNTDMKPVAGDAVQGAKEINMTADQAWNKMLDAMGGKAKLRAVKSLVTTAKISGSAQGNKFSGTLTKTEVAPNKAYTLVDLGAFKDETVCNGKTVRRNHGGGFEEVPAEERAAALADAHIFNEAYLDELKGKVTMVGMRDLDGKKAIAVEVKFGTGPSTIYYLSPETFLPMAMESEERGRQYVEDYRSVDGIMLAHLHRMEPQPGVQLVVSDFKYTTNGKVDAKLFDKK